MAIINPNILITIINVNIVSSLLKNKVRESIQDSGMDKLCICLSNGHIKIPTKL